MQNVTVVAIGAR